MGLLETTPHIKRTMKDQLKKILTNLPVPVELDDIDGVSVIYLTGHRDKWALEIYPSTKKYLEEEIDGTVIAKVHPTFAYSLAFDLQNGGQAHEEETMPSHFLSLDTCIHAGLMDMISCNLAIHIGLV